MTTTSSKINHDTLKAFARLKDDIDQSVINHLIEVFKPIFEDKWVNEIRLAHPDTYDDEYYGFSMHAWVEVNQVHFWEDARNYTEGEHEKATQIANKIQDDIGHSSELWNALGMFEEIRIVRGVDGKITGTIIYHG